MTWRRGGALMLVVLIIVAGAALILDSGSGREYAPVVERLAASELAPADLVAELARTSPILILSDVRGLAAPKRIAADAVRSLAEGPGLDAVLLEVPSSEQRYIDAYLAAEGGDAAALLGRPRAVQERAGMPREYLRIYQAVRAVNEGLNPSRRVRVIAADVEAWPPAEETAPRDVGRLFAGRAEHMLQRLDQELFSLTPDARVLVFVDGYLALQGTHGRLEFGGGEPVRVQWLGELLRRRSGAKAATLLLDPGPSTGAVQRTPGYRGTALHRPLRRELDRSAAVRVRGELADVADPVLELSTPGLSLEILPAGYRFGEVAQGYVFLTGGR